MGLLSLLLYGALALAGEFFVEGPEVDTRAEAVAMAQAAQARAVECRVVRRYRHGTGWVYVVVSAPYGDRISASSAATTMAGSTGRGMTIFATDGDPAPQDSPTAPSPIGGDEPAPDAADDGTDSSIAHITPEPLDNDDVGDDAVGGDEVARTLRRIERAHGGADGGDRVLSRASSVVFRYTRTTPEGQVIDHTFARRGEERYLSIDVREGDGVSMTVSVTGVAAWSTTKGGAPAPVDRQRALETIERFSPEHVLGLALTIATDLESRPELQRLRSDGQADVDGDRCEVLRYDGDRVVPPFVVAVSTESWRVRQVGFDNGVLKDMTDYRATEDGLVYPMRVQVWRRRAIVDTVNVAKLELDSPLPAEWLSNPFATGPSDPTPRLDTPRGTE